MNKTIIVGAAGYIGSALGMYFPQAYMWDSKWFGTDKPDKVDMYWDSNIEEYDNIIYLAGLSSVSACSDLTATLRNNVVRFKELLDKINEKQKLIFASSASIYGNVGNINATEDHPLSHSLTHYDMGMSIRESLAVMANKEGKKVYALRFGTVAGCLPGQKIIRDNTVINAMVKNAIVDKKITITNGDAWRSFVGIKDITNFMHELISWNWKPGIYNVKSFDSTIQEIGEYIAGYFAVSIDYKQKSGNPYDFTMCASKASGPRSTLKSIVEELDENRRNLIYTEWK